MEFALTSLLASALFWPSETNSSKVNACVLRSFCVVLSCLQSCMCHITCTTPPMSIEYKRDNCTNQQSQTHRHNDDYCGICTQHKCTKQRRCAFSHTVNTQCNSFSVKITFTHNPNKILDKNIVLKCIFQTITHTDSFFFLQTGQNYRVLLTWVLWWHHTVVIGATICRELWTLVVICPIQKWKPRIFSRHNNLNIHVKQCILSDYTFMTVKFPLSILILCNTSDLWTAALSHLSVVLRPTGQWPITFWAVHLIAVSFTNFILNWNMKPISTPWK